MTLYILFDTVHSSISPGKTTLYLFSVVSACIFLFHNDESALRWLKIQSGLTCYNLVLEKKNKIFVK